MLLRWRRILTCLILLWLCSIHHALCPSNCTCQQTTRGFRKVSCTIGHMQDPIPIDEMDYGIEVLEISAPENQRNHLTIGPVFQRFRLLQELYLRRSNILQIGTHPFWGVPTLKKLDLTSNNLSSLHDYNFRGLVNLVELNLDDNYISGMQSGVFKHLTELRILTIQRNRISEIVPRLFIKLGKLHVLKMNGNHLVELTPEVFKDIPELRVLECRGCGLRRINTQIYHLLPYLAHLDLGNNRMQFISSDEFYDLHRLHSLKLDGNQLPVVLEHTFIHQQQLRYLCLARNRLAKITTTAFLNLTSLVDLDIGFNKLDKLEVITLQPVSQTLQRLVLSGNSLSLMVIRHILQIVHHVWDLEMAQMNLARLPDRFLPDQIRRLNLSRNNLSDINIHTFPSQLTELDLSQNQLKGLEEKLIFRLEYLKDLNLNANSWICNLCYITSMMLHVNRTNILKNLTCASPANLRGRLLTSLHLDELTTCKMDSNGDLLTNHSILGVIIGVTSFLVFLVISIVFVIFLYLRRKSSNLLKERTKIARSKASYEDTLAMFSTEEINYKIPLDLTERRVKISTIYEIKTDLRTLSNGTGI